jgi:hypothetical protein
MAFPIIPIRNAVTTSEAAPLAGSLQLAEIAVNTQTNKLYMKGNSGVVEIGGTANALTTNDITQLAVPGKIPQLNASGLISAAQIQGLMTGQVIFLTTTPVAGLAPQLGADGKIPTGLLPSSTFGALTYKGGWNVNTSPVIASGGVVGAGTAEKGDYYVATNSATLSPAIDGQTTVRASDIISYNGTTWDFIDGAKNELTSINGVTAAGDITLTPANIGALSTTEVTQLSVPGKVPQLDVNGIINSFQLPFANAGVFGIVKPDPIASNGFFVYGGDAKIIPGTSTIVGGVKSSASIEIAVDGTATVASAGTY